MAVHTVKMEDGDILDVQFAEYPNMFITMPYDHVLEVALQARLHELHQKRYAQHESNMGLNSASQLQGAVTQKRW